MAKKPAAAEKKAAV
jgi:hypothetical protein